ncbi:linoleate diol synthase [Auriscalpium vulgare]|uniref:Linoleate diol synthase n=1 Tax=Auriscalpium vulgare TaxID=40419 RepID=A0ACB8RRR7_9AGAM|nr:linoleate diol synthase [Auriscalpium vulgare]
MATNGTSRPSKFMQRASTINPVKASAATTEHEHEEQPQILKDFREQVKKGFTGYTEPSTIASVVDAIRHLNSMDDRKMLLEHVLTILAKKEWWLDAKMRADIERKVVEMLYDDLSHPPATYLGQQYSYRTADGSYNNISDPNMGKAGMPYARTVQQTHPLPQNMLPDAGLVFDTLLKRDKFVKHPAGLSSLMFSFAALVVHTVFRTSHQDVSKNETSSYVDLSPLYGHNEEALEKIRVRDGRGLLYPDTFAEDRLLLLPPAVCALLVLFSRNHNYIARKLLEVNERGTFVNPDGLSSDDPNRSAIIVAQEEEIFQTARLINCGWFGSAVFSDYFGSILGLVRQGSNWSLNPFGEFRDDDHKLFERGRGNVCSVEFNCLYRWHATTSQEDEKWVETLMGTVFGDKPVEELTVDDFKDAAKKIQATEPDIHHWTFGNMKRQEDGTFKDSDLAAILKNATEHPASAFKARGTPHVMRLHEIMGIESNRRWGVCSLNEFRKFLGLKPYASFLEWNTDPEIANAAEKLYDNIDNLELYVGLQAEEAKPVVDGAGLCPGYTISRAILSDAIALTRGDRFFTADYTPFNMTAWGFADCQRNSDGPGNGSTLGRLLLRGLPGEFTENSTYTWFPLQTPDAMKGFLGKLGVADKYDFVRPADPVARVDATQYRDVEQILKSTQFTAPYGKRAEKVIKGEGFFLAATDPARGERDQREVLRTLTSAPGATDRIAQYFYQKTRDLLATKSYTLSDKNVKSVDIAKDVLRYLPLHWAATELAGISLKTDKNSPGTYTERQLYDMLTDIFAYLFLDVEASKVMVLEAKVAGHVKELQRVIKSNLVSNAGGRLSISGLVGSFQSLFSTPKKKTGRVQFANELFERGATADEVTNSILALLVGTTVEFSQNLLNIVNFYVDEKNVGAKLSAVAAKDSPLDGYIYEALRIDPPFRGVYRVAVVDQIVGTLAVKAGQKVFLDLANASRDPDVFPDPENVDLNRTPKEKYLTGDGVTRSLGEELTTKILTSVLRAVFELPNLRRGIGQSGYLKRYLTAAENTQRYEFLGNDQLPTPWPNTLVLQYDAPTEAAPANGS